MLFNLVERTLAPARRARPAVGTVGMSVIGIHAVELTGAAVSERPRRQLVRCALDAEGILAPEVDQVAAGRHALDRADP